MTIKNTLLGGSDFSTPSDRVKPTDLNDTFDVLGEVVKVSLGSLLNESSQNLFNAAYIGFDSRLNNTGAPTLKNVFYSIFTSDDADTNYGFIYDATDDLYKTPTSTDIGSEYIIIEATSYTGWTNGTNDVYVVQLDSGKWLVYCDTGTDAVKRAQIHKSLWYGTDGTDQLILDFTTVTSVQTSNANDVGKQAHYSETGPLSSSTNTYTGTFVNTTTNDDCSSWSLVKTNAGTTDEFGLDLSADENNNPATCQLDLGTVSAAIWEIPSGTTRNTESGNTADREVKAVILCEGDITWVEAGSTTGIASNIDFKTDNSIPDMIAADTLANEGLGISTLIFKDTASASVTNAIPIINSTIDATSSEQISISADGGSNYTDVDNAEIARPTAGTALWRRIVITRTDLTKEDIVTEQAVKYNLY